ncbi:MAG: methionine adenosyltransferase [Promethearchaeota archaeon]|nr:MAG: methionine adenosyltransferase [Candidatus Lokiarchaeota archaeon]
MNGKYLFSSESVSEGHPDKICDQISDAFLDAVLEQDPDGHVACETYVTTGMVLIGGEITTNAYVDIQTLVRRVITEIGYTDSHMGFEANSVAVLNTIHDQSPDIAQGVIETEDHEQGSGDQGLMFGYASNETPELMPLPILLAHQLVQRLAAIRKDGTAPYLRPDGKSQVTIEYEDGKPKRVHTIVIAAQHNEEISLAELREKIITHVVKPICGDWIDENTIYHINGTGRFVVGGPHGDTGLTGRKIIVDTYGGMGAHGGGCFSGKDPSKVDRSASYFARYVTKNCVAAGLCDKMELQVAYCIGVARPMSINVECFGTNVIPEEQILSIIEEHFDFRPAEIIKRLNLKRPIYQKTAAYGHFGRKDPDFTWELTDAADILRKAAGL